MKKYKRIYIEITNICNLSCPFCSIDNRKKKAISLENMEEILKKIDKYTDYIYLHVKGEPLIHRKLKEILDLCSKYNKKVNITTNGTLLKEKEDILGHSAINKINISLHSENNKTNYLEDIFSTVDKLKEKTIIYRFWTMNNGKLNIKSTELVDKIIVYYKLSPETVEKLKKETNIKLRENLYVDKQEEFIWPSLENKYCSESGYCYGTKNQLAILVDGTVIPCCLDSNGLINLGNIYKESLEEIIYSDRYKRMEHGFSNRNVTEELCKHCSYKERFDIK